MKNPDNNSLRQTSAGSQPIGVYVDRFTARIDAIVAQQAEILKSKPRTIPCARHPNETRTLDGTEWIDGNLVARYAHCSKCSELLRLMREAEQLKECEVPTNLHHCTLDNWTPSNAQESASLEVVREFTRKARGFLILLGYFGTGKTHLAVGALRAMADPQGEIRGWFIKQNTLLRQLRESYHDRYASDPINHAQRTRLLVLDDVGFSSGGRDEIPMLHEILDYRFGEVLPSVLTSNLGWQDFKEMVGPRMADRLSESAFRILEFTGPSHRAQRHDVYGKPIIMQGGRHEDT